MHPLSIMLAVPAFSLNIDDEATDGIPRLGLAGKKEVAST
jgi:hypothetical protein